MELRNKSTYDQNGGSASNTTNYAENTTTELQYYNTVLKLGQI